MQPFNKINLQKSTESVPSISFCCGASPQTSMEKQQCGECQLEINDLEPLCCGFCEVYFHINQQCCGLNIRNMKEPLSSGKIMFICHCCREELKGRSIRRYIAEQHHQTKTPALAFLPVQVQQLHDVVAELSRKVDSFSITPQRCRPTSLSATPIWPRLNAKRRREDRPDFNAAVTKGTKTIDLSDLSVPSISAAAPPVKFWLYLSRLNPLITDDDVQSVVSRCLSTTDPIDVVRLVPKGKDTSNLTFVSFKVGLDPDLKDCALDPASWPSGLQFREFVDLAKN